MARRDDDDRPRFRTRPEHRERPDMHRYGPGRVDPFRDHGPWRGMREGDWDEREHRHSTDEGHLRDSGRDDPTVRPGDLRRGFRRPEDAMRRRYVERGAFRSYGGLDTGYAGDYEARAGREARPPGPYKGIGPKGWARSNERIHDEVCQRLADDDHLDPGDIEVEVRDGEVTLKGTVDDRSSKRRAERITEAVAGVRDVHNHLTIRQGAPADRKAEEV